MNVPEIVWIAVALFFFLGALEHLLSAFKRWLEIQRKQEITRRQYREARRKERDR